jgi:hypothetical protein
MSASQRYFKEEADGGEARRRVHVEPVPGAVRHADQIALLAADLVDLVLDVQREQTGAGDEETDRHLEAFEFMVASGEHPGGQLDAAPEAGLATLLVDRRADYPQPRTGAAIHGHSPRRVVHRDRPPADSRQARQRTARLIRSAPRRPCRRETGCWPEHGRWRLRSAGSWPPHPWPRSRCRTSRRTAGSGRRRCCGQRTAVAPPPR